MSAPLSGSTYPEDQENINPNNPSTLSSLNISSLSELEEMIKGAHPSSSSLSSSSQSDLMQKLKALQLIEQMISTQEQLVSGRHGHRDIKQSEQESHLALSRTGNGASPLRASNQHSQQGVDEYTISSYLSPIPRVPPSDGGGVNAFGDDSNMKGQGGYFVNDDCAEEVTDSRQNPGVGGEAGNGQLNGRQEDEVEMVRPRESEQAAASHRPSIKEKREEQLRLLNEKIAKRHSKLPRKRESTNKIAQASSSVSGGGASKQSNSSARKQQNSSKAAKPTIGKIGAGGKKKIGPRKAKGTDKATGKSTLLSKSVPTLLHGSKSTSFATGIPPSYVPLSHDPPSQAPPTPHLLPSTSKSIDQSAASPQLHLQHQLNSPQVKSLHISELSAHDDDDLPLESMSYLQLVEAEEMTAPTDSSELLDSTSYLIPVEGEGERGDETLVGDVSAMTDDDTTMLSSLPPDIKRTDPTCEEDSLASTLTQAYGFSTTSDFLSTLAASSLKDQCRPVEDPSASSTVKSNGNPSPVETSFLPPSTASESTMTVDKAASVIQAAWYVCLHTSL